MSSESHSDTTADGSSTAPSGKDAIQQLQQDWRKITQELHKVIVGQEEVIEELIISLLAGGHCLLVGVPGLAKTLMVQKLAETLNLSFNRIQFTPDLMPADITGTEMIHEDKSTGNRSFRFLKGPIFSNVVLADEINRTPPKTQSALLEAMQEHQVTIGGEQHRLPDPFFVLATQNPIEQEGTYPLPEAQLDRFMFQIMVDYPTEEEEFQIVKQTTTQAKPMIEKVLSIEEILALQQVVRNVPVADYVIRYGMNFSRLTRRNKGDVPDFINEYVSWGAGPRASQCLILAAKAKAILEGEAHVTTEHVKSIAAPVLRHRVITNFKAEADGVSTDDLVKKLADIIPADPTEGKLRGRLPAVFRSSDSR